VLQLTGTLGQEQPAVRWTSLGGLVPIGGYGGQVAISRDGSTVASDSVDGSGLVTAGIWTGRHAYVNLGGMSGGGKIDKNLTNGYSLSGDGSVLAGLAWFKTGKAHAFRWDEGAGMVDLGTLGGTSSRANAVAADGKTIVGWDAASSGYWRGAIWQGGVEKLLENLGPADACNSDGSVIVGRGFDNGPHAYVWRADKGAVDLGILSQVGQDGTAYAFDVSEDGRLVVGASGFGYDRDAFLWTEATGMVKLDTYLRDQGVTGLAGWRLGTADAISDDETGIAGWGFGPRGIEGWVVTLPNPVQQAAQFLLLRPLAEVGGWNVACQV
jgi:probable HAF family extracellular repeat protein